MKEEKRTVNVTAKVTPETRRRLERIRDRYGFRSVYEIVQYLLSAFLREADPEGEAEAARGDATSEALWEAARLFEGFEARRTRLVTAAPESPPALQLRELVAVFDVAGRRRRQVRRLTAREDGGFTCHTGEADALSGLLHRLRPAAAALLGELSRTEGLEPADALYGALSAALIEARAREHEREVEGEFQRLQEAEAPRYGERTRRKHAKSPDSL